jgi:hypothetical protein
MDEQINKCLQEYNKCQRTKKDKRPATNFCSPLPQCRMLNSYGTYGLIWTPQNTRKWQETYTLYNRCILKYVELVTIADKSAPTVVSALFSRYLCMHGLPLEIVSDMGK